MLAAMAGLTTFSTGKPCKHGHMSPRSTKTNACVECSRVNTKARNELISSVLSAALSATQATKSPLAQACRNLTDPMGNGIIDCTAAINAANTAPAADPPPKKKTKSFSNHTVEDEAVARGMFVAIKLLNPKHKLPNFDKWADEIRLIRECDGRTHDDIARLFRWANLDSFWQSNILSPATLRKQWDKLTIRMSANGKTQHTGQPSLAESATLARKECERILDGGDTFDSHDVEFMGTPNPHLRP